MEKFVSLRNVSKIYQMGEVEIRAVDGIDFDIEKGERTTPSFLALDPVRVSEIKPFKTNR